MPFLEGDKIVNKRNGSQAVVVKTVFDGSVHAKFEGKEEPIHLSVATVKRWYRLLELTPKDVKVRRDNTLPPLPKGEKGCGPPLRKMFEQLIKANVPQGDILEQKYNPKSSTWVYRLNGKNIFECTESKYRFCVLANPKAMTPQLLADAYTTYPKERNWALATRFVFTSKSQQPFMKTLALAGIYSRSNRK